MLKNMSKIVKIYLGLVGFLLIVMILLAGFSHIPQDKCYVCGKEGIAGKDLSWGRVNWQYYDYPSKKFRMMPTPGTLCEKCAKIEKEKVD